MLFFDVEGVLYADRMERAANGNPVHHDAVAPSRDHDPKMGLIDRREIEFDAKALVAVAVGTSQRAAASFGLPDTSPSGVRFYPDKGELDFLYGRPQMPQAVRLKAEAIGALLVLYCIRTRIPMSRSRKADKGVRVEAASVVLAVRVKSP